MLNRIKNLLNRIRAIDSTTTKLYAEFSNTQRSSSNDQKNPKLLVAKLLTELNNQKEAIKGLADVEFQVFSQFGDDGIIQYIISHVDFPAKTFIEFGVETYKESNTRFLLVNNNWSGMVIDGSQENINFINGDPISFYYEIHAKQAFISKENINGLLSEFPFGKEVDILSIDIDGNDYFVWKEINVINPILVIVEYNSVFGPENPWTIPYDASYVRTLKSSDVLLYGTSLQSICDLADEKGYYFIGCNSAGNNAYFLRKDKIGPFKPLTSSEGYVASKFSEFYDETRGVRVRGTERLRVLEGKTVFNTRKNSTEKITL